MTPRPLPLSAGSFSRRTVLAGVAAASLPMIPACAQGTAQRIAPEQFGARGDGRSDDGPAFQQALDMAARSGLPIALRAGARYRLGGRGWRGLGVALAAHSLVIEGNGATVVAGAIPAQRVHPEFATRALLLISGGEARIGGVDFELNGLPVAAIAADRCHLEVTGCRFENGQRSRESIGVFATRSGGALRANSAARLGHMFYLGYTDRGMHVDGFTVSGNRGADLVGDFAVGVMKNTLVENNDCTGMFAGVAFAGYAAEGAFSENVQVVGNRFADYRSHGVQSDIIGELRARNVQIARNVLSRGVGTAAGIYVIRVDGFVVSDNQVDASNYGVIAEMASRGRIERNVLTGRAGSDVAGIVLAQDIGTVSDITVADNEVRGFRTGVIAGGPKGRAVGLGLARNRIGSAEVAVRVAHRADQIRLDANILTGSARGIVTP